MRKLPYATISVPSTEFDGPVVWDYVRNGDLVLRWRFYHDGELCEGGIRFHSARAYQWRAETHCTLWHIEDVYDTLAEVIDSPWVEDLQSTSAAQRHRVIVRHYMIYFDSDGCFEVAAGSFELLEDRPVEPPAG